MEPIDEGREELVTAPDGVALSVREWGNPAGAEILLIHGAAQCTLSFMRQTSSMLAQRHRIIAFDLRGHGCSAKPLDPASYQDGKRWAEDVAAVMDAKALRRPVLVGWSLGGRVVRQYLMQYGDARLSAVNFLSTRPIEHPDVVGPGSRAIALSRSLTFGARLQAEIQFLRDCFAIQPGEAEMRLMIAYNMIFPRAIREAIGAWATDPEETRAALGRMRVPALVTHGRLDRLILPKAAEMTAAAVKNARISWFDACGHSPFHEDAPRYNRELDQFVTENWRE
jgi:non-heme chloroperoxidase